MSAQIDAIRKRLSRITPGRWEWQSSMPYGKRKSGLYAIDPQNDETVEAVIEQTIAGILIRDGYDAAFIEHAPADITALLSALDAANAEIERLRGQCTEGDHR